LKGAIEFADSLLLVDSLVALQALDDRISRRRDRLASAVFPHPGGPSTMTGFCMRAAR